MEKKRILGNLYIRNRKKITTQSEKIMDTNSGSSFGVHSFNTFITLLPRGVINLFTTRTFGHTINTIHTITEPRAAP